MKEFNWKMEEEQGWDTGETHKITKKCDWMKEGKTIWIEPDVYSTIQKLCTIIELEWQAMLIGTENNENVYVTDYWIPKQEVTAAHVKNLDCVNKNIIEEKGIIATIHSHSNMKPFFSPTDEELTNNSLIKNHIVVNNKMDFVACSRIELPCGLQKFVDMQVKILFPQNDVKEIDNIKKSEYYQDMDYMNDFTDPEYFTYSPYYERKENEKSLKRLRRSKRGRQDLEPHRTRSSRANKKQNFTSY